MIPISRLLLLKATSRQVQVIVISERRAVSAVLGGSLRMGRGQGQGRTSSSSSSSSSSASHARVADVEMEVEGESEPSAEEEGDAASNGEGGRQSIMRNKNSNRMKEGKLLMEASLAVEVKEEEEGEGEGDVASSAGMGKKVILSQLLKAAEEAIPSTSLESTLRNTNSNTYEKRLQARKPRLVDLNGFRDSVKKRDRVSAWLKFTDICMDQGEGGGGSILDLKDFHDMLELIPSVQPQSFDKILAIMRRLNLPVDEATYRMGLSSLIKPVGKSKSTSTSASSNTHTPNSSASKSNVEKYQKSLLDHEDQQYFEVTRILKLMKKNGIQPTILTYNVVLSMYANRRKNKEFSLDEKPTSKTSNLESALSFVTLMEKEGIALNEESFNILIRICVAYNSFELAQKFMLAQKEQGFFPSKYTYSSIIKTHSVMGDLMEAMRVFAEARSLQLVDATMLSIMLDGLYKAGKFDEVERIVREIRGDLRRAAKESDVLEELPQMFAKMFNTIVTSQMVATKMALGDVEGAFQLVDELEESGNFSDTALINAVVEGCCKNGEPGRGLRFIQTNEKKGGKISMLSYRTVLEHLSKTNDFESIYELYYSINTRMKLFTPHYNIVLATAKENLDPEMFTTVWRDFERSTSCQPNQISFTLALELYTQLKKFESAKRIFLSMIAQKFQVPLDTLVELIEVCIQSRNYSDAAEVITWLRKLPNGGKSMEILHLVKPHMQSFMELVLKLSEKVTTSDEEERKKQFMIIDIYNDIIQGAAEQDEEVLAAVMKAYTYIKDLVAVVRIWTLIENSFPVPRPESVTVLLKAAVKLGQGKTALVLMSLIQDNAGEKYILNLAGYEALLALASKFSDGKQIPFILLDMDNNGIKLTESSWQAIKLAFLERKAKCSGPGGSKVLLDKTEEAYKYIYSFVEENFPEILIELEANLELSQKI